MSKTFRKPVDHVEKIAQKILLSKGPMVTPRLVNSALAGKHSVREITEVMKLLTEEGLGVYHEAYVGERCNSRRKLFIKRRPEEITAGLEKYGAIPEAYATLYNMPPTLRY